jgi:choline-sulfatase
LDAANLLIIMSDEHDPRWMSCAGSLVHTPNLDRLAARGTRFTDAYTTCPICVPARAAFATGKYLHQIGYWDNADPYEGSVPSWHHRLRGRGHRVVSVGKLHFRSTRDDNGFSEEIIPMNVYEEKGDLYGLLRGDDMPARHDGKKLAGLAGPGESEYTWYDREIASRAQIWLREEAPRHRARPWVLFVSFVAPHFPLTAPPHWYYRYYANAPMPKLYALHERPAHPAVRDQAENTLYDTHFKDGDAVKRARAGYFGLVSSLDENIGNLLGTLEDCGLAGETRVLYTSDHGDNLGARGLWGKQVLYEEAAKVPMILAGPGVPAGAVRRMPVSHVDVYPTVIEGAGAESPDLYDGQPGVSLFRLASGESPERTVLSEYHASSSRSGEYMVRHGKWKYVYYVHYPEQPQLFDLESDPEELRDLGTDPAHAVVRKTCHARLAALLDPEEVDRRAKRRQAELVAANGGREAVIRRGSFAYSPPPGFKAEFAA